MRPKLRKRIGVLILAPIVALSVASILTSSRSVVGVHDVVSTFLLVGGIDISFLSDKSSLSRNNNESFTAPAATAAESFSSHFSPLSSLREEDEQVDDEEEKEGDRAGDGLDHYQLSFSACLLVMDDNFRIPEWVAYHYYAMQLRHLVVAVDPRSTTLPTNVLDRWKSRIRIEVWTNDTFVTTRNCTKDISALSNLILKKDSHRCRQIEFYQSCARHLKGWNRTWTSFHDIDEFLVVPSSVVRANVDRSFDASRRRRPGYILRLIQHYASQYRGSTNDSPPTVTSKNKAGGDETDWPHWLSQPCFTVPRILFSATEHDTLLPHPAEEAASSTRTMIALVMNASKQLDTVRYRYQATPVGGSDGLAKSIMDVSRLPIIGGLTSSSSLSSLPPPSPLAGNAHRPFRDYCTHAWPKPGSLPLVIHHYLGSWEAFSFRDDARRGGLRTIEKWHERSNVTLGGVNTDAVDWIRGFVRMVGHDAARELLKDAGLPPDYKMSANRTALWRAQT